MTWLFSLMKRLVLLLVLTAVWVGVLWFGIRLDISRFNLLSLIGLHTVPPFAAWASWSIWRRRSEAAKIKTEENEREQAEAAQATQRESARHAFAETMRVRHFALDCRWATVYSSQPDLADDGSVVTLMPSRDGATTDRLLASLGELLPDLFESCPAAQGLPIYIAESTALDYAQAARVVTACCNVSNLPPIMALPTSAAAADAIFSRFENDPNLPGALFLAVDGPNTPNFIEDNDGEDEPVQPKQADVVVALLFTHPNLDTALADVMTGAGRADNHQYDPMTPFWERNQRQLQGLSERVARLPEKVRTSLPELPVWGQLRRPARIEVEEKTHRTQNLSHVLEQAGINAALIEKPFETTTAAPVELTAPQKIKDNGWVVHNAGTVDMYGSRLASISSAMSGAGIELALTHESTNVATAGDYGCATPYLMLALAAAKVAELQKPSLVTHFQTGQVAMAFVLPIKV